MKKTIIMLFTVMATFTAIGQNFEGKISYSNTYKSKKWGVSDDYFKKMFGTKQDFYIKDSNYKAITNGTLQWTLYINKNNKLYSYNMDKETVYWTDATEQDSDDIVTNMEINKKVTTILGYECDEVILTSKSGTTTYYYSSQIVADAKLYSNHKAGNWYDFVKATNSLPLKTIVDGKYFYMESVAIAVKVLKLDAKAFSVPANSKVKKNPF